MKRLIIVFIAVIALSCDPVIHYEEEYQWGCHYKEIDGKKDYYHCCTRQGYNSENLYVIDDVPTKHSWVKTDDCKTCK